MYWSGWPRKLARADSSAAALVGPLGNMGQLILKRAPASRPSRQRSDDDFDVLADGAVVRRTLKVHAAPVGTPWMWTLAFGHQKLARSKKHLRRLCVDRAEPLGLLRFVLEGSRDLAQATSLGVRHARAGFSLANEAA
jgi:hypothetical protein